MSINIDSCFSESESFKSGTVKDLENIRGTGVIRVLHPLQAEVLLPSQDLCS